MVLCGPKNSSGGVGPTVLSGPSVKLIDGAGLPETLLTCPKSIGS
jgi:hypothetical protein